MKSRIFFIAVVLIFTTTSSFYFPKEKANDYYIIISKNKYELSVYDHLGWLVTYPVVFGNKDLGDKLFEGDRRTPEGTFRIISKKIHKKWDRFIAIDYPNAASIAKFKERKKRGIIPANAKIGGGIGIHGVWPHENYAVDQYQNWTEGCISMKNKDVEDLFSYIPIGTKVIIRP